MLIEHYLFAAKKKHFKELSECLICSDSDDLCENCLQKDRAYEYLEKNLKTLKESYIGAYPVASDNIYPSWDTVRANTFIRFFKRKFPDCRLHKSRISDSIYLCTDNFKIRLSSHTDYYMLANYRIWIHKNLKEQSNEIKNILTHPA